MSQIKIIEPSDPNGTKITKAEIAQYLLTRKNAALEDVKAFHPWLLQQSRLNNLQEMKMEGVGELGEDKWIGEDFVPKTLIYRLQDYIHKDFLVKIELWYE